MLRLLIFVILVSNSCMLEAQKSFKSEQIKNKRVKAAYVTHETELKTALSDSGLTFDDIHILIQAFKLEKKFNVYVKKKTEKEYSLFRTYDFCVLSGVLGPKRKEGDLQVPEGFYYVNWFNPNSDFHLSLKVNYPNASDKILSDKTKPGGEIFIHGNCVSIGCIPLTDPIAEELYILAVEATKNGQLKIPVYIFPCELMDSKFSVLSTFYSERTDLTDFWKNLKEGFDKFHSSKTEVKFTVDKNGKYIFN